MRTRSISVATAGIAVAVLLLAGCGPTTPTVDGPTAPASKPAAAPAPSPTATVKDLTAGNCTMYTKDSAAKLIGPVNLNNKALDINTGSGTKIDVCSYLSLQGSTLQGISYAVVRFDSAATAYAQAQSVRTEMLTDANEHDFQPQPLTAQVPGAGPLLGGYGTKTNDGVTYTIAVVGTNVGPYLVVALGASTLGADKAENFALTSFQALAAASS
jgi:hypothetical protein